MQTKALTVELLRNVSIGNLKGVESLIEKGAKINGLQEETPLGIAILKQRHKVFDLLVLKGADVSKPHQGQSLLELAVKAKNLKAVDKLLQKGADPNQVVVDMIIVPEAPENNVVTVKTLLMIAIELKDYDVTRSLLKAGANPLLNAGRYDTAFDTAMDCERCEEYFHQLKKGIKRPLTRPEAEKIERYILRTRERDN